MKLTKEHILYQDDYLIAINKPAGLPVHKNDFMPKDAPYLLKYAGELTGKSVYNIHRLDAQTSGVILLAFDRKTVELVSKQFRDHSIEKTYLAIVFGFPGEEGVFDFPVKDKNRRKSFEALTRFKTLKTGLLDIPFRDLENIRTSLVEVKPETGRWHQIRQHFGLKRHYILGDNQHGNRQLNRNIKTKTGRTQLLLHARSINFIHPETGKLQEIAAPTPEYHEEVSKLLTSP